MCMCFLSIKPKPIRNLEYSIALGATVMSTGQYGKILTGKQDHDSKRRTEEASSQRTSFPILTSRQYTIFYCILLFYSNTLYCTVGVFLGVYFF